MKYADEEDIKIIMDRLRLLNDGVKQLNKPYSRYTQLEIWQYAFPTLTYVSELLQIIDQEIEQHEVKAECSDL
jgi:hypothetical protein